MNRRLSLIETWQTLEDDGYEMPRDADGAPFVPPAMPNHDDDELGFSFYKEGLEDGELCDLTLPRTFFGRSLIERVAFVNTDLSQSRMCWNDFLGCDFSHADLAGADLRASRFVDCRFVGSVLRDADLRGAEFTNCDFTDADMTGATAVEDPGPEPPGG